MQVGKLRQSPTTLVYTLRHRQRENCESADTQGPRYAGHQVIGLIPCLMGGRGVDQYVSNEEGHVQGMRDGKL